VRLLFRGENHLQHSVGIFKKVAVFVALRAENLGRQLRGNLIPATEESSAT